MLCKKSKFRLKMAAVVRYKCRVKLFRLGERLSPRMSGVQPEVPFMMGK